MKRLWLIALFFWANCLWAFSQNLAMASLEPGSEPSSVKKFPQPTMMPLDLFREVNPIAEASITSWNKLVEELDLKASKTKDDLQLIRQIFQKSHQRLFKKYEQHSSFNAMLASGSFDCVSGSAVIGMLLDRYRIQHEIIETDYHVFILAEVDGKKIVLESTLPVGGMITTPSEVEKYLASYEPNQEESASAYDRRLAGPVQSTSDNTIFRKVSLQELAGLQFYNDAIVHFNSQAYTRAISQLKQAYMLYPSERILGLMELSQELANNHSLIP